ncbi:hypothetical protein QN277_006209 [Acacia crassicarpa]|uniref:BED-type domain-containing protein n=1 Tax=Acacia crassicarpa TaxID=499986 RepID=A0AAE1MH35_9FABA|nr:hypothetical protein QN277_006209 [Acacia crassicarpa]
MATSSQSKQPQTSTLVKPTGDNIDMAWQWNSLKDINNRKSVTCDFCKKVTTGGITRAKKHQMGIKGDVNACTQCPPEVKNLLKEAAEKKKVTQAYSELQNDNEEEEIEETHSLKSGKRPATSSDPSIKKAKNVKGLIDLLLFKNPEANIKLGKNTKQTSINDACDKEARDRTCQYIAQFFYRNGIAFNVARTKSFKLMVDTIGNYGKHLKPPSYHELRVPFLKKEIERTNEMLKKHKEEWVNFGCSIMSDAWTDKKNRTLINFMVNSPSGTMFVRSVDASSYMKTGEKIFQLLDDFVEEIGEKNVVQVVTDNGSNYVLAGKLLTAKRTNLYWTPCAAHCLDLMLEDIGKLPKVKTTIQKGISLVGFIYNHSLALNTMRKYTKKTELVRYGVTRFATTFLTLQRLHKLKNNLRMMVTSDEWSKSKAAKDAKGKRATDTILSPAFWNGVVYSLKAMGPLVRVLRLVDNEKKSAMGYIYEAMDRAKEAIQRSFNGNEDKYKEIFAIIDKRWESQLHHPLHAAAHFLNPELFYKNPQIELDEEVTSGLYQCIERLIPTEEEEDKIIDELSLYKRAGGNFSIRSAIRQRTTVAPAEWWRLYGASTPSLQKLAIKVLSLTCSASGCERSWSTFEHIHSKKRSKLEHQKLQDLVFVKYNQALKERFDCRDVIDPILLNDIDDSNEWLVGEIGGDEDVAQDELVFEDDTLTWGAVADIVGASEPRTYTRQQSRLKNKQIATSTSRTSTSNNGKRNIEDGEEEANDEESDNEEEEIYKSSSGESNNDEEDLDEDFMEDEIALIPILCQALEHIAKFLRRNFSQSTLYRKYMEEACVWVESNTTPLIS